jgi:putative two-component system response regulator
MVTSRTENSIRYRALELGANDFLTKPIDAIELAARAANMLALADARRKLFDRAAWLSDEVRKATQNILLRERETIECLTLTAEYRDNETGMHILRIGQFSALIGRYAGLSEADVDLLLLAAPMHDIGKVATPDHILLKPGKLDAAEWEIMKQHTVAGFEILKTGNSPLLRSAADIAIGHHEKYDGTGYPFGRAGDQIPLFARICAISDVFDALASDRPYKTAWTIEKSVEYVLERAGTQFDPDLIVAFRAALPEIIEARTRYADKAHDAPAAPPVRYGT